MATQETRRATRGGGELYAPGLTLGEARARLFAAGGLGEDGGYGASWVWLKMWRIPFAFPNTDGRRRAVRFHDLHHVLTEYPTTWRGEFEIAAWEVAAGGINRYWEGWLLDLLGFACGLAVYPRRVYRAFMRGRRSANLYFETWDDSILARRVGDERRRLGLDTDFDSGGAGPTWRDRAAFVLWAGVSAAAYLATGALMFAPALALAALAAVWWLYYAQ
ncbi:MAG TPA: hypothetical protein VGB98_15815 [Pyrinomonadaceae bacterium]|jgi:hypothetical protein